MNELKERSDGLKATAEDKDIEIQEVIRQIAEAKANLQVNITIVFQGDSFMDNIYSDLLHTI